MEADFFSLPLENALTLRLDHALLRSYFPIHSSLALKRLGCVKNTMEFSYRLSLKSLSSVFDGWLIRLPTLRLTTRQPVIYP